jgi:hypothetical protein
MRSVGQQPVVRLLGASLLSVSALAATVFGCSSDPVRKSGNHDRDNDSGGNGSSGSSSAGTGAPGGSENAGGNGVSGTDSGTGGGAASGGSAGNGTAGDSASVGGSTAGSGGDASAGTTAAAGGSSGGAAEGGTGNMPCQMASYTFEPKIPTVFMLVDQSGSMFDCQDGGASDPQGRGCADHDNTSWYPLRDGALELIEALQAEVRFGFAPLGGEMSNACPNPMLVAPDFNNYDAIAAQYNALEAPEKGETPVSKVLDVVGELLLGDTSPGDRFILLVTDGEPDYCSDGDGLCPADSAVFKLQTLYTAGVRTLVFGLPAPQGQFGMNAPSILAAFANAGAGEPVLRMGTATEFTFWDECNFKTPWAEDLVLTGKPAERGSELGTYSPEGGTATVYQPEATNQQALVELLRAALSGVKSCTFDLSNVNGQSIKVDLNKLAEASVAIEGVQVPQDPTNGWSMASETQLVLNGAACDTWRTPENDDIAFNFPCNTIIFE